MFFALLIKAFDLNLKQARSHQRKAENKRNAFLLLFSALRQTVRSHISVTKPGCAAVCAAWFCYAQNRFSALNPKPKFRAARNIQQYFSVAFRGLGNAPFKKSAKHNRKAEKHQ
ncbi:MAG: hypothetical protein ACXW0U_06680 [Halobacteriota archaeon]